MGECGPFVADCSLTVADLIALRMPEDDHEDAFWCPLSRLLCGRSRSIGLASSKSSSTQRSLRTVSECPRFGPCVRKLPTSLFRGFSGLEGCSVIMLNDLRPAPPRLALLGNSGVDSVSCFLISKDNSLSVLLPASCAVARLLSRLSPQAALRSMPSRGPASAKRLESF